eukprot:TRINITY_DN1759_c0_g1_i1.p1 TRINITY_DN1759_c0_g1~~TRINITY_DN1759_c0_g1_i1.p1  ORF type:complete len:105 (-),score=12.99 TRINITY_DN1759_c0_g1_i1:167-481(-)
MSLLLKRPDRKLRRRNLDMDYYTLECATPVLSAVNAEYEHFNSIHLVHDQDLGAFIIYLNGDPIYCQYEDDFVAAAIMHVDVKDYSVGTSVSFGDLTYTARLHY